MQEFFTWNSLLTSSGATVATSVVTQLIKEAPLLKKIPTRLLRFGIALCILMLALIFDKSLSLGTAAISVINAAVVALAANGMFDAVSSGMGKPGSGQSGDSESAEPFPTLPTIPTAAPLIRMYQMCMSTLLPPPSLLRRHTNFTTAADVAQKAALRVVKTSTVRKIFRILRI